jgi:hypothetical protein
MVWSILDCACRTIYMLPPSSLVVSSGMGAVDLPLRASNEGLLRPRVARAQEIIRLHPVLCSGSTGPTWVSFQFFSSCAFFEHEKRQAAPAFISFSGVGEAALYCAHRTSTFLSCAFCEQEGHLAAPFPFSLSPSTMRRRWKEKRYRESFLDSSERVPAFPPSASR